MFEAHWMGFSYAGIPTTLSANGVLHLSLEPHHQVLMAISRAASKIMGPCTAFLTEPPNPAYSHPLWGAVKQRH